jgi:hypothetical protein
VKLFRKRVDAHIVSVERDGPQVVTRGLERFEQQELAVPVLDEELADDAADFLRMLVWYLENSKRTIKPDETVEHGFWMVKFRSAGELLEAWEPGDDGVEFVRGADRALRFWRDQARVCEEHDALFCPPRGDQLVAVSNGVWEGRDVEGTRYPSPEHMSGWWVTTDLYDGDVESLRTEHAYHMVERRPDLVEYLALPPGFWFRTGAQAEIGFDPALLEDGDA